MESVSATAIDDRSTVRKVKFPAWLPLVILPIGAVMLGGQLAPWLFMWTLAFSIFAGLKWLSFADFALAGNLPIGRKLAYLFLWPGMNTKSFLDHTPPSKYPALGEWLLATAKVVLGVVMVVLGVFLVDRSPILGGWVGGAGLLFMLHFGLFHLLSLAWRQARINAVPIMNAPILATSLSNFWGRRWNLAFRDLAHAFVFRPSVGRFGVAGATMAVFLIVLVIVGFGLLSILLAGELSAGTPLARGVCLFIALFWAARLVVQFFVFDAKPYLKTAFLKAGYHGLTFVFLYHAVVYSVAAFGN